MAVLSTAIMGALFSPPLVTLAAAPTVGLLAASQVALAHPGFPAQVAARRFVLSAGAGCAVLVLFVAGASELGAVGGVMVMTVLLTGAVVLAAWLADLSDDDRVATSTMQDARVLEDWLGAVPMSALVEQWRLSEVVLSTATDPDERSAATLARELLLDEMTRRDPAGVHRWLQEGADAPPSLHVRDDPAP
ncbi:hypothetical protein [Modestobacter altitudinis]|uniref:hypothetical protein n=1 Tax=Modestobacter altitudinis TaxID=2213158 RepID=UPI00110CD926|nr:hypothetical protein [Modestobacter altitudinis]